MAIYDSDTFHSLHALGEHVLAAGRYNAVGRIGLTVVPGGIATPAFGEDERSIGIVDGALVVSSRSGERRAPITTLRAAAEFAEITPGAPSSVYAPATPFEPDAPLTIDVQELRRIVEWYQLVTDALVRLRSELSAQEPSEITLWPEHFDVAIRVGEVNYGGLVGDAVVPRPYLYVGPPAAALPDPRSGFWNAPFGAARADDEVRTAPDALDFFRAGVEHARRLATEPSVSISPG